MLHKIKNNGEKLVECEWLFTLSVSFKYDKYEQIGLVENKFKWYSSRVAVAIYLWP